MNESSLKSSWMAQMKSDAPGFVAIRHEDVRTSGIPDASITGCGRTTWWEAKYGTPDFQSTGIQELTMLRLSAAGYARYVIWEERKGVRRTLIVHPKHLADLTPESWCVGFDMKWLVNEVRKAHGL